MTGIILKGRYCIVDQIGSGGEGRMYLARDLELGIFRAVKELPISNRREAGLLRLLEHPVLPKMIDYAEREGFCYIIMEYIQGKSLAQLLKEGKVFSLEEVLQIGDTVLNVLDYLHSRKPAVFYGDLKPDNLMMTSAGTLYLVDFGSAVFEYQRHSYRTECKGTRGFAAPEQYRGGLDQTSDFYCLGKTLECLCGRGKWRYILRCPYFGKFIFKCCRPEAGKRWKNAAEASEFLNNIHPLKLRLRSVLVPLAAAVLMLAVVVSSGVHMQKTLPELSKVLTVITKEYYGFAYQSGNPVLQARVYAQAEAGFQRLLKQYHSPEDQIRILELLAYNGELADHADRAELYYRQLLTYEPEYERGYLEYGRFLCRQARYQESRAVYRQWQNNISEKSAQKEGAHSDEWKKWKKEILPVIGRNTSGP